MTLVGLGEAITTYVLGLLISGAGLGALSSHVAADAAAQHPGGA